MWLFLGSAAKHAILTPDSVASNRIFILRSVKPEEVHGWWHHAHTDAHPAMSPDRPDVITRSAGA